MRRLERRAACLPDLEARWNELKRRMLAVSQHLWTQGNICRKWDRGGYVWRLRYYERLENGSLIQRTIRIGRDPVLLQHAEELLECCRRRREWLDEIPVLARLVEAAAVATRRRRDPRRAAGAWIKAKTTTLLKTKGRQGSPSHLKRRGRDA